MNSFKNFINKHKLGTKTILLYSCHYDSEKNNSSSVVNSNFYHITGLNVPNLLVVFTF